MDLALFAAALGVVGSICALALFMALVVAIRRDDRRHAPSGALSRCVLGTYAHHCHQNASCSERR